ncbi:MAG: HigA family addiction module antitoxin [Pseudomonadota bacterium]
MQVISPGEVLKTLYLEPLEMSAGQLAKAVKVPRTRIERIVKGETAITPDTALRLARYFQSTPQLWLNMQSSWDLQNAEPKLRSEIDAIEPREVA